MAPFKGLGVPWPGSCLALQENVSSFLSQRQSYELRATELVWTTHHWTALEKEINLSCLKSLWGFFVTAAKPTY